MSPLLCFPPELEYEIFLFAFQNDHKDAKNLILIAKRVFDWLIPHVFRVVTLYDYHSTPIRFNESVYQRYGHHTRHLLIGSPKLGKYLHLFPNIIDMALWIRYDPIYLPLLLQLPLARISINPEALLCTQLLQVLTSLTHLEITDYDYSDHDSFRSIRTFLC
ncbi:hypothetical protein BDN72DRAFT_899568 [Pluteus cervinus]|uniref:Uncharacterized protein n=1 Tax=Pluteus cervinus TaxID=181527 RepID=A0ACD3ALD2_9AGAR|nr:hypothetical protein BDN72DRAFT_899568 [Pluteus cervinus]